MRSTDSHGTRRAYNYLTLMPDRFPSVRRSVHALAVSSVLAAMGVGARAVGQVRTRPDPAASWRCTAYGRPDRAGRFLAPEDMHPPTVLDGDDWLVRVNRSPRGTVGANYAPRDLVDLTSLEPADPAACIPQKKDCMRREAALAYHRLAAAMRAEGEIPWVDSAYRGYGVQCNVFAKWAYGERRGLCAATAVSALPGHSQHQLGTTLDLFTRAWVMRGDRFREGYGCSSGGQWLAEHAWAYGFVLPYPLHPDYRDPRRLCAPRREAIGRVDPRTGYKYEPWHLRYIGLGPAAQFHAAWVASGPGTAGEITLEQWLASREGAHDVIDPAVCDGCACGACATFHPADASTRGPCGTRALVLDREGRPMPAAAEPALVQARVEREGRYAVIRATVYVPPNTLTQPPVVTRASRLRYPRDGSFERLTVVSGGVTHAYPTLPSAWRLAIGRVGDPKLPYRAALVNPERNGIPNGINARIPATPGRIELRIPIEAVARGERLLVALSRGGELLGARIVRVP